MQNIKGKKILIMGGAGFIGHNLALKIKDLGGLPFVTDGLQVNNLGYYTSQNENNSELYISFINERLKILRENNIPINVYDIRDYNLVSQNISAIKPDVVVHLAAVAHANRSNKDPFSTFDHSLRTLENVLDTLKNFKNIHLIYFSSSMVYGNFENGVASEEDNCEPLGIYGALKYGAEKLVISYSQVFDTMYSIIRPSALYGERCVSRRVGQALIENALMGKELTINGDGEEELDFTYIQDLIQGVIKCIISKDAKNEIFNITFGKGRKLNELAEIIKNSFPNAKLIYKKRDNLMPMRGTLNINKAKKKIGFQPEFPIEKGLEQYINWYKDFALLNNNLINNSS